ncbi:MAG: universal stress protein [Methanosarcinales archaeon]|nr:universal stress protein [Methanosarcinales archaeon]
MSVNKILVAVDGSECTKIAINESIGLAVGLNAELHSVCVIDTTAFSHVAMEGDNKWDTMYRILEEDAQKAIAETKRQADNVGISVTASVLNGHPVEEIISYIKDNSIDLVVVGSHGRGMIEKWVMGSVAEKLARTSPVSVIIAKQCPDKT